MNRYLFVIDYQNDFVDGALGFPGAEKLDEKIAAKVRAYGKGHVLFTRDTHFDNYLETREGKTCPSGTASREHRAGRFTARLPGRWRRWKRKPSTSWFSGWM